MKFDCILGSKNSLLANYISETLSIPVVDSVRAKENVILTQPTITEAAFSVFAMDQLYAPQVMEKFDLLATPYYDIVQMCNENGFYCMYIPYKFKARKATPGNKILAPKLTEEMFINSTETLYVKESNFEFEDWAVALNKSIVKSDDAFRDYFNNAKICLVERCDSFYAQYARSCNIPCDKPACLEPAKSWNAINYSRSISERDAFQRHQRWKA